MAYVSKRIDVDTLSYLNLTADGTVVTAEAWVSLWQLVFDGINNLDTYCISISELVADWRTATAALENIAIALNKRLDALDEGLVHYGEDEPENSNVRLWIQPTNNSRNVDTLIELAHEAADAAADSASDAKNSADTAESFSQHPPIIGDNGNWLEWDGEQYQDTGKPSRGEKGEKGDPGSSVAEVHLAKGEDSTETRPINAIKSYFINSSGIEAAHNVADGKGSIALGWRLENHGDTAFAAGSRNIVGPNGATAVAFGTNNKVDASAAFVAGEDNEVNSHRSAVFGRGNRTINGEGALIAGTYNEQTGDQTLLDLGNGTDDESRSSAFTVFKDGSAKVKTQGQQDESVAQKKYVDDTLATKSDATHIKNGTGTGAIQNELSSATNVGATAFGYASSADGDSSFAAGSGSKVDGNGAGNGHAAGAIGLGVQTGTEGQVVLGKYNERTDDAVLVVGNGNADATRSNAFVVHNDGRATVKTAPSADMDVATKKYVDEHSTSGTIADVQLAGTSIVEDGVANIPKAGYNQYGVVKTNTNFGTAVGGDGQLYLAKATDGDIDTRNASTQGSEYKPITPNNLDHAVKAALCDGEGTAWTANEQKAARERMGIPGEWVLKGTLSTDNKDTGVSVDLSGCTEMFITGVTTCTAAVAITCNIATLVGNFGTSGVRRSAALYQDNGLMTMLRYGQYVGNATNPVLTTNLPGNSLVAKRLYEITIIKFNTPADVTESDIKIYAR